MTKPRRSNLWFRYGIQLVVSAIRNLTSSVAVRVVVQIGRKGANGFVQVDGMGETWVCQCECREWRGEKRKQIRGCAKSDVPHHSKGARYQPDCCLRQ